MSLFVERAQDVKRELVVDSFRQQGLNKGYLSADGIAIVQVGIILAFISAGNVNEILHTTHSNNGCIGLIGVVGVRYTIRCGQQPT